MQAYPINELERLTGIKAHTIRIWEKRYGLITPDRTKTNRRYYSDSQFKKLLNVTTLLGQGYKISTIASFTDDEINQRIQNEITYGSHDNICQGYVNDLVKCMLAFDEAGFDRIYADAVSRFGLYSAVIQVIYPFLHKTGVLWNADKAAPVQEHFASGIIKRKLMAATDALAPASKTLDKFILFLPAGEWHDLGLLFANYILRSQGCQTIYLGQNVPKDNLSQIIHAVNPGFLLTFYVLNRPVAEIEKEVKDISRIDPSVKLLISGNPVLLHNHKMVIDNVTYLLSPDHLLSVLSKS